MQDLTNITQSIKEKKFPIPWHGHFVSGEWITNSKINKWKSSFNPSNEDILFNIPGERESSQLAWENFLKKLASHDFKDFYSSHELSDDFLSRLRNLMLDYEEPIIHCLRIESGKTYWDAKSEITASVHFLEKIHSEGPLIRDYILNLAKFPLYPRGEFHLLPLGLTVGYIPFSTPLTSFITFLASSFIAKTPLCLFTGTHASLFSFFMSQLITQIADKNIPLAILFSDFEIFREHLSESKIKSIFYTGSREHCDQIRRESRGFPGRQLILQSGGKNSILIHSSADIKKSVALVCQSAFRSAGQLCTSGSRIFIHQNLKDEFCHELLQIVEKYPSQKTDDLENKSFQLLGPLYSKKAMDKFLRYQTMAQRECEQTILWGKSAPVHGKGFFVLPGIHLFKNLNPQSSYQNNVLFSPDLAIYPYSELSQAIQGINQTDAPYVVSFIGDDEGVLKSRHEEFLAPNLLFNLPTTEWEISMPLAGRLNCGQQRFTGLAQVLYLSYPQAIISNETTSDSFFNL